MPATLCALDCAFLYIIKCQQWLRQTCYTSADAHSPAAPAAAAAAVAAVAGNTMPINTRVTHVPSLGKKLRPKAAM